MRFDIGPDLLGHVGTREFFLAKKTRELGRKFIDRLSGFFFDPFTRGLFFFWFSPKFAATCFLNVRRFRMVGIFGRELIEGRDNHVAFGEIGAGKERFAKAGFAGSETTIAANSRAGTELFRSIDFFAFFWDVDDAFTIWITAATEERAETAVP